MKHFHWGDNVLISIKVRGGTNGYRQRCGNSEIKQYSPLTKALEMVIPGVLVSVSNNEV